MREESELDLERERAAGTLGEVLYTNASKALVSETEWVALVERISAGEPPPATAGTAHPDNVIAFEQQRQALLTALQVLTPDERHAIEAAFFSELTYAEVAAQSNQPLGTIKTRIRSGLQKLGEALAEA